MMKKWLNEFIWVIKKASVQSELPVMAVLLVASTFFSVGEIWIQKYMIDAITGSEYSLCFEIALIFGAVILLNIFFQFIVQYYGLKRFHHPIRKTVIDTVISSIYIMPLKQFTSKQRLYYIDLLTYYAKDIGEGIVNKLVGFIAFFQCVLISVLILCTNYRMFLVIFAMGIAYLFIGQYFTKLFWKEYDAYLKRTNELHGAIEEGISATREVIVNDRREWEKKRYEWFFDRYYIEAKKVNDYGNLSYCITNALKWTISIIVLFYGGILVMQNKMAISTYVVLYQLCSMLIGQMEQAYSEITSYANIGCKIENVHNLSTAGKECTAANELSRISKIKFDSVSFRYQSDMRPVLRDISLDAGRGMKIGIVGKSGSGKSTITKLLMSMYEPENGSITINDTHLSNISSVSVSRLLGYCPQDPYIFADTVKSNILLGRDISDDKLYEICGEMQIYDFISSLENGFDTKIGDRGINISGGQRQRLALTRMLIGNPDVLILDEATSALDIATEKKVMDSIDRSVRQGKILIVVAHRLYTVADADYIYVVGEGEIIESGTHSSLMKNTGVYYHMYTEQA